MPEEVGVIITLRDLWIEMQEINKTLIKLDPVLTQMADHEVRIRSLERFKLTLAGGLSALTVMINVVAYIVQLGVFHK
jgi:hypothetical protein